MAQPWIRSASFDGLFILSPALLSVVWVLFHQIHAGAGVAGVESAAAGQQISVWGWLALVVAVDVSHVYSTFYRTYLDPVEFKKRHTLYTLAPLVCWVFGILLYSFGSLTFWRFLAYLAVFHFIRQQYGFLALYSRKDELPLRSRWSRSIDVATIYSATLYPLIHWHLHLPRNFQWFVAGDFLSLPVFLGLSASQSEILSQFAGMSYLGILTLYGAKELHESLLQRKFNLPKNLLVTGTALSWYLGIVRFNGDLAFTVTNVISHGIPYLALIWIHGRKQASHRAIYSRRALPLFLGALFLVAYLEEGLWDSLIWRDHSGVFTWFSKLPHLVDETTLMWVVPLLALPQFTHYVLDGFIWRVRGKEPLFSQETGS